MGIKSRQRLVVVGEEVYESDEECEKERDSQHAPNQPVTPPKEKPLYTKIH
jgi:hypothetical protein